MMSKSSLYCSLSTESLEQYSRAAAGSWIEQGPMTTRRRFLVSRPLTMATDSLRPARTVAFEVAVWGMSCWRKSGAGRGL